MGKVGDVIEGSAHFAFPFVAALLSLTLAIPVVVALAVSPEDIESGRVTLSPPCPIRDRRGADCPGCGLTRATAAFGHGEWRRAVAYHRGGPVVFIGALLGSSLLARLAVQRFRERRRRLES